MKQFAKSTKKIIISGSELIMWYLLSLPVKHFRIIIKSVGSTQYAETSGIRTTMQLLIIKIAFMENYYFPPFPA